MGVGGGERERDGRVKEKEGEKKKWLISERLVNESQRMSEMEYKRGKMAGVEKHLLEENSRGAPFWAHFQKK